MDAYGTCKINTLAQNIMDALEYDNFAVVVLEKLCMLCMKWADGRFG